jgi:RNA-binding protein 39
MTVLFVVRRRSRSGSRSRKHRRDRSRSRDRSRDRKDRDRRDRSKDRERSKDRKDRERSKERKERERSKERKDREGSRERKELEAKAKAAEVKAKTAEAEKLNFEEEAKRKLKLIEAEAEKERARRKKEIDDLTKDQRTVFVSQLVIKTTEKQVEEYFSLVGKVNGVIMIRDKNTGRHKGFAYVEMGELESVPNCLALNGIIPDFQKFPILVKASEAEKNFIARKEPSITTAAAERNLLSNADSRIYVGNLHVNISEIDLRGVLSKFGSVDSIHLQRDEVGTSKGYAFVQFSRTSEAQAALSQLAGMEIAGRVIKVGNVNDNSGMSSMATSTANAAASGNWKLDDDEGAQSMFFFLF